MSTGDEPSDADLHARVREAVRSLAFPTTNVMVSACSGTISLRGEVETVEQAEAIRRLVAATPGVSDIDDFLHRPGEVAPNKVAAIRASRRR